ncbi:MAG: hypothetical protein WCW46_01765 [Candidatus Paceibacterota bacterium]|jgi:pimeloyl-ACP methyl ester carboxylesterase
MGIKFHISNTMKKVVFLVLFFVLIPVFAFADTTISSPITSDATWSPSGGVYIIDSYFSVASGATLTIEPGTMIKAKTTAMGGPSIYGKLIARGTENQPVYFTSFWNDEVGGDTDGTGPSVSSPGEWQGLYFKPGSEGILEYIDFSYAGYGGYGYGDYVSIENDGGTVDIKNSYIHENFRITSNGAGGQMSAGNGIYNISGTLSLTHSIIENNIVGVRIDSGDVTISNNEIRNNVDGTGYGPGYGISAYGPGKLTLTNNVFSGNDRTGMIEASKEFIHSGNTSSDIKRKAFGINGVLSQDTTLSAGDLPYIIEYLVIPAGITLTIEPGVIIKMEDRYTNGSINVQGGNLIAKGTAENKIYITSLKDDSIGGDTNGDGDATTPAPRNWASIFLENGSNAEFDYVTLGYGGFNWNGEYLAGVAATIYQRGANLSISNSILKYNSGAAIYQDAGTTTISKSELVGDNGLWSRGGAATISQSSLVMTGYGVYNDSGKDLGWWWETKPLQIIDARDNWWGSADGPNNTYVGTPTGSGTMITDNVLYTPFLGAWPPVVIEEPTINPVIIIPGIMGSVYKDGVWTIDPIFHVYDNLIETLENNGYVRGESLFPFGYDWKNSNIETAALLKQKIDSIKNICDCNQVDIIAHSMGGLVARSYAQSGGYENDIDQLIFLGTPHQGAPKDYLIWEAGEFPPGMIDGFIKSHYEKEAKKLGYDNLFDYIHQWPIISAQELLPISNYLQEVTTNQTLNYPIGYPKNDFLENLKQGLVAFLESDIDILNIISDTESTITGIRVVDSNKLPLWEHGYPENYDKSSGDKGLIMGSGDGTVPIVSASISNSIDMRLPSGHINLPTDAEEEIFTEINGGEMVDPVKTSLPLKILFAKIFSPADFVVIAPDGKRIGKDFVTGNEINEIPGAFYSGFNTDDEYLTIPDPLDGEYKIQLQGTDGGGSYSFETTYISDQTSATAETSGVITPNQITDLSLNLDNQNPENIKVERVVTLDTLITDINEAYILGWIKDKKTRDGLIKEAKLIIKFEKKRNGKYEKRVDKIIIKLIEKELDFLLKKNKITVEARDLLKNDLIYIINNN